MKLKARNAINGEKDRKIYDSPEVENVRKKVKRQY